MRRTWMDACMTRSAFLAAAAGAALSLAACGGRKGEETPGDKAIAEDAEAVAGAAGDDAGRDTGPDEVADENETVGSSGESPTSNEGDRATKSDDLVDKYGNPTLYALLNTDGELLQRLLSVLGFEWNEGIRMYMAQGRAFAIKSIDKYGTTALLDADEIASLGTGGSGNSVYYTMNLLGYTDPETAMRGIANVPVEDIEVGSSSVYACVHGSNMQRHIAEIYEAYSGSLVLDLITEDAIKKGAFTSGGGAPLVPDYWEEKTGRKLGSGR